MCWYVAVTNSAQCMLRQSEAASVNSAWKGASFSNSVPRTLAIHASRRPGDNRPASPSDRTATVAYSS